MATKTLWRAADSETIVDCASFAVSREVAETYLQNPGFGGGTLYRTEVEIDADSLLDLYDVSEAEAMDTICDLCNLSHPGAIGVDEWVPRISYEIREAGIEWVRVRESYPADTETWIFVGEDDPELEEADAA